MHYYHELASLAAGDGLHGKGALSDETKAIICDETAVHDLKVLLNYLKPEYLESTRPVEIRYEAGVANFQTLWLLFKPGSDAYAKVGGQLAGYVVASIELETEYDTEKKDVIKYWNVTCWNLQYRGRNIVRSTQTFVISDFHGEKSITKLRIFPSRFLDSQPSDLGKTRQYLEKRGADYYNVAKKLPLHVYYKGLTWTSFGETSKSWNKIPKLEYEGDIILDPPGYTQDLIFAQRVRRPIDDDAVDDYDTDPRSGGSNDNRWTDYDDIDPMTRDALTKHHYFLFPRRMNGFTLKRKDWRGFDLEGIKPLNWSPDSFSAMDRLILPEYDKNLLKALSAKYADQTAASWSADFISGKGEGQIFLLHGAPGTGKTYTVECVADYTRRPLLSLTVADIGTTQREIEDRLSRWFASAVSWDAVLLIDEADVFLEKRNFSDLNRNGLVSVFLRCMEYYKGMLFLTTNRIGHIDDAFLSRISVALMYENLGEGAQQQIWTGFLDKLERERRDVVVTHRARRYLAEDPDVTKLDWNGREIRNTIQTALALARYDAERDRRDGNSTLKVEVDKNHFDTVLQRRKSLVEYRNSIHRGRTQDERAAIDGSRSGLAKSSKLELR